MSFFNDDPFEEIVREFFEGSPVRRARQEQFIRGEDEERIIDFVEDNNKVYLVFELPGFNDKDISVKIKAKELEISAKKSNGESIQDYLDQKLRQGIVIQKKLPKIVNTSRVHHYVNNGVLEIVFDKQKGVKR